MGHQPLVADSTLLAPVLRRAEDVLGRVCLSELSGVPQQTLYRLTRIDSPEDAKFCATVLRLAPVLPVECQMELSAMLFPGAFRFVVSEIEQASESMSLKDAWQEVQRIELEWNEHTLRLSKVLFALHEGQRVSREDVEVLVSRAELLVQRVRASMTAVRRIASRHG